MRIQNIYINRALQSLLLKPIFFAFVKEVDFGAPEVNNLWAAISVFFLFYARFAVVGIRYSWSRTNDAAPLVGTVVALVTDAHQHHWVDVRIADYTASIAFFAQAPN